MEARVRIKRWHRKKKREEKVLETRPIGGLSGRSPSVWAWVSLLSDSGHSGSGFTFLQLISGRSHLTSPYSIGSIIPDIVVSHVGAFLLRLGRIFLRLRQIALAFHLNQYFC